MPSSRHERTEVEAFLDSEFRQVWAADRATGEPRFLPDGQAKSLRVQAKADWRCPVPDCRVEITTVGGTNRRHHFRHNAPSPHASEPESEFHLAAKAMIAAWAGTRLPPDASVQEERSTTKNPVTSRHRIADVMVTWGPTQQTAFEVEYKNYAPEDWAQKQTDYDQHQPEPIACVWLLGHLRVKRPPKNSYAAEDPQVVRIPLLGQAWATDGRPVLVVNPVTRQIGTILSERHPESHPVHPAAGDNYGRLHVDELDDCDLDPRRGLVTPTMRRVDDYAQQQREAEQRRLEEELRQEADRARRDAYYESIRRKQQATWEATDLHAVVTKRWGHVPELLGTLPGDPIDQSGVWANPQHWRTAIYEELIHPATLGPEPTLEDQALSAALLPPRDNSRFTFHDIRIALSVHQINTHHRNPEKSYKAVLDFLLRLQKWLVVAIHKDRGGKVLAIEPTGYPITSADADCRQSRATAAHLAEQKRQRRIAQEEAQRAQVAARKERAANAKAARAAPPPTPTPAQKAGTVGPPRPAAPVLSDRTKCSRCQQPLPEWQRGGTHTFGCP